MRYEDGKCVSAKALRDIDSMKRRAEKQHAAENYAKQHSQKYSSANLRSKFYEKDDKHIHIDSSAKLVPEELSINFIETASNENEESNVIATQLGALNKTHYGPYVAHSRKCPTSQSGTAREKVLFSITISVHQESKKYTIKSGSIPESQSLAIVRIFKPRKVQILPFTYHQKL